MSTNTLTVKCKQFKAKVQNTEQQAVSRAKNSAERAKTTVREVTSPERVESKARAGGEAIGARFGKVASVFDGFRSGFQAGMNAGRQPQQQDQGAQEAPRAPVTAEAIDNIVTEDAV